MDLPVRLTKQFKKDVKRCQRQGKDFEIYRTVDFYLRTKQELPNEYRDHALVGDWKGFRECHLGSDWLLIYRYQLVENLEEEESGEQAVIEELQYARMGSHFELFE